jgi:hypothetical protein
MHTLREQSLPACGGVFRPIPSTHSGLNPPPIPIHRIGFSPQSRGGRREEFLFDQSNVFLGRLHGALHLLSGALHYSTRNVSIYVHGDQKEGGRANRNSRPVRSASGPYLC